MGVANQVGMSPGQVLLRWAVQGGCAVLPKSAKEERRMENMEVLEWKLGTIHILRKHCLLGGRGEVRKYDFIVGMGVKKSKKNVIT